MASFSRNKIWKKRFLVLCFVLGIHIRFISIYTLFKHTGIRKTICLLSIPCLCNVIFSGIFIPFRFLLLRLIMNITCVFSRFASPEHRKQFPLAVDRLSLFLLHILYLLALEFEYRFIFLIFYCTVYFRFILVSCFQAFQFIMLLFAGRELLTLSISKTFFAFSATWTSVTFPNFSNKYSLHFYLSYMIL